MAPSEWPTLVAGWMRWPRLVLSTLIVLATLVALLIACIEIFASPFLSLPALAAGVLVRSLGQRLKLNEARYSAKLEYLSGLRFDGQTVACDFNDLAIQNYVSDWRWIITASIAAGMTYLLLYKIDAFQSGLSWVHIGFSSWLNLIVRQCRPGLPLYIAALCFRIKGPEQRWVKQLKSLVAFRCTTAVEQMLARQEFDGLGAAIDLLWQNLGVDRKGAYRAAILSYLQSHAKECVREPSGVTALLSALTELAQFDLKSLSAVAARFAHLEREIAVVQALAQVSRNPLHEMRAAALKRKLRELPVLASNRLWDDLTARSKTLQMELDDLRERLSRPSASTPTVALPSGSDPYRILGVTVDTPTASLRKLRSRLAQLYHPDIPGSPGNSSKMSEVNAAYDAIMRERERQG